MTELRQAIRAVFKRPGFAILAIAMIALGLAIYPLAGSRDLTNPGRATCRVRWMRRPRP